VRWWRIGGCAAGALLLLLLARPIPAQQPPAGAPPSAIDAPMILQLHFRPVGSAQLAIWVEREGEFVSTLRLTQAVARRGLGNRPGASQMNSGFRWPYGRREGALPVWARRRASQPGARSWRRVIFQNRVSEGYASRSVDDSTPDEYYCLSHTKQLSRKDALDAVSCATLFHSDKGRFITEGDVAAGYAEPYEQPGSRLNQLRALELDSLYPPRRDVMPCSDCLDHPDAAALADHAIEVMPELDAVTMATPSGDVAQSIVQPIPAEWPAGAYRACVEINTEGDYNQAFNESSFPTPLNPAGELLWDGYAEDWGYPYRGQPSVVYCADFRVGEEAEQSVSVAEALGTAGTWDMASPSFGEVLPMTDMTDDPVAAPGSGADRLQLMEEGYRLKVVVQPPHSCNGNLPPSAVDPLAVERHGDRLRAHQWAQLRFGAASDDAGIYRYDVRVSTTPIIDDASFMAGMPATQANDAAAELLVPTQAGAGEMIEIDFGGLSPETHYHVAVRAIDWCAGLGPIRSVELDTPEREFATVTPCFVATAAWGSPLAAEIGALRRLRDRQLSSNGAGRALVAGYGAVGPALADLIRPHDALRALARTALRPIVALAGMLEEE